MTAFAYSQTTKKMVNELKPQEWFRASGQDLKKTTRSRNQSSRKIRKIPPARKLRQKKYFPQAASRVGKLPVTTQRRLVMVNGPANRTLLSKKILKFCGAFPIYNTEIFNNPVYENGYASKTKACLLAYAKFWPNVFGAF